LFRKPGLLHFLFPLLFLLLIVFPAKVHSLNEEPAFSNMIASGIGTIIDQNQAEARNEAVENAMQRVVEQATNILIKPEMIIKNYELLKHEIFRNSSRYIQSYRSFYENPDMSLKRYEIGLEAVVSMGNLKMDLASIGLVEEDMLRPKMLILIEEKMGMKPIDYGGKPSVPETALMKNLEWMGFEFIDPVSVRSNVRPEQIEQAISGNSKAAAALGFQYGANVVIIGKAVVSERTRPGYGTTTSTPDRYLQVNISASAVDVRSESILVTGSENNFAMIGGSSFSDVHQHVITQTCLKLSGYFTSKLSKYTQKTGEATRRLYMTVDEITVPQLAVLRNLLKGDTNVVRYLQKSYQNNIAKAEIDFTGSMQAVVDSLVTKNFGTFQIRVVDFTDNRVHLQATP
jgi:hypothetical protein